MRSAIWLLLVACGSSSTPKSTTGGVTVELASVTLADDCGDDADRPPPSTLAAAGSDSRPAAMQERKADMAKCQGEDCRHMERQRCDQTSMQLSLSASEAAAVRIKKVEFMTDNGAVIGELA